MRGLVALTGREYRRGFNSRGTVSRLNIYRNRDKEPTTLSFLSPLGSISLGKSIFRGGRVGRPRAGSSNSWTWGCAFNFNPLEQHDRRHEREGSSYRRPPTRVVCYQHVHARTGSPAVCTHGAQIYLTQLRNPVENLRADCSANWNLHVFLSALVQRRGSRWKGYEARRNQIRGEIKRRRKAKRVFSVNEALCKLLARRKKPPVDVGHRARCTRIGRKRIYCFKIVAPKIDRLWACF